MEITYSSDNEDILFAIEYLNLPINYIRSNDPSQKQLLTLKVKDQEQQEKTYPNIKDVLTCIYDICKCDPHDLNLINEEIINETLKIKRAQPKIYLKKILSTKPKISDEDTTDMPSNIQSTKYLNGEYITIADLLLFAKVYKTVKEGERYGKDEMDWFLKFQSEIEKKVKIKAIIDPDFDQIEIRVGKIVKLDHHANADKLFVENVQIAENNFITVVSGLRGLVAEEKLIDKNFLFVTNLKHAKLRGVMSQGMILCVKIGDSIEVIKAPKNAEIGSKVEVDGDVSNIILKSFNPPTCDSKSEKFKKILGELKIVGNFMTFCGKNLAIDGEKIQTKTEHGEVS